MITAYIHFAQANIRDIDGCDSDQAVDVVENQAFLAALQWAQPQGIEVDWTRLPKPERAMHTFAISMSGETVDEDWAAAKLADELADAVERASSEAIQAGDWEAAA